MHIVTCEHIYKGNKKIINISLCTLILKDYTLRTHHALTERQKRIIVITTTYSSSSILYDKYYTQIIITSRKPQRNQLQFQCMDKISTKTKFRITTIENFKS